MTTDGITIYIYRSPIYSNACPTIVLDYIAHHFPLAGGIPRAVLYFYSITCCILYCILPYSYTFYSLKIDTRTTTTTTINLISGDVIGIKILYIYRPTIGFAYNILSNLPRTTITTWVITIDPITG